MAMEHLVFYLHKCNEPLLSTHTQKLFPGALYSSGFCTEIEPIGDVARWMDEKTDWQTDRFIIRNLAHTIMEAVKPKVFRMGQWCGRPRESQCSS